MIASIASSVGCTCVWVGLGTCECVAECSALLRSRSLSLSSRWSWSECWNGEDCDWAGCGCCCDDGGANEPPPAQEKEQRFGVRHALAPWEKGLDPLADPQKQ